MSMACRNLCERLDSKIIVGKSIYEEGKKYCRLCEVYFLHDGLFCPFCGMRLRVSPVNKKGRNRREIQSNTFISDTEVEQIV